MPSIKQIVKDFFVMTKSRDNPNEVTAAQLNTMSKEEAEITLAKYLEDLNLNIGKYGDKTWTPPNVLGSYEGGARYSDNPWWAACEEDDGSLSLLENGTNGISTGVYYTFFNKGEDGKWNYNATPRRYEPTWLEAYPNKRLLNVFNSDGQTVVWGDTIDTVSGYTLQYIALTNGTMDPTKHVGALIESNDPLPQGFTKFSKAVRVGDYVYWFEMSHPIWTKVRRCKVQDILDGKTIKTEAVEGWTTTGINGVTHTGEANITLSSMDASNNPDDDSLLYFESNVNYANLYDTNVQYAVADHTTGIVRILQHLCYWVVYNNQLSGRTATVSMLIEIDTINHTATVHPDCQQKCIVQNVPNSVEIAIAGKQLEMLKHYGEAWGQTRGTMHLMRNGDFLKLKWGGIGAGWYGAHTALKEGASPKPQFEQILPPNMAYYEDFAKWPDRDLNRKFGSLIGADLRPLGPSGFIKDMFSSKAVDPTLGHENAVLMPVVVSTEGTYNGFTYSGFQGNFAGYKPTNSRKRMIDNNISYSSGTTVLMKKDDEGNIGRVTNIAGSVLSPRFGVSKVNLNINIPDNQYTIVTEGFRTVEVSVLAAHNGRFVTDSAA